MLLNDQIANSESLKTKITGLKNGPVSLIATFYMPIPKRLIKKKDPQPWKSTLPTTKPDTDNLIKGVKDVLNKLIFNDDSQVTHEFVRKLYAELPGMELIIKKSDVETCSEIFAI